jgi:hypothetical protein
MSETYEARLRRLGLALDRAMPRHGCRGEVKIRVFDHLQARVTEIPYPGDVPPAIRDPQSIEVAIIKAYREVAKHHIPEEAPDGMRCKLLVDFRLGDVRALDRIMPQ